MNNRYCVIMSGGVGSRFWPVSRNKLPKQFIDFFGTGESMLQMTYNRFSQIVPKENIYIITHQNYKDITKKQLPDIDESQILVEPQRRNTAPCVAWAAHHIKAKNKDANIVITPADHVILNETLFKESIDKSFELAASKDVLLTLGINPTRVETAYGYIQKAEDKIDEFYKVKTFTEKPDSELAKVFIDSGEFLWNSGIFIWNVNSIIKAFEKNLPDIHSRFEVGKEFYATEKEADFISDMYPSCPNLSIDFGIIEKASNIYVLPSDFGWSDMGSWGSLYNITDKDENSNVSLQTSVLAYESHNNIVSLPADHIAVIQGLEDYIVAESGNVLIICKKSEEQRISNFVTDAKVKFGDDYI